MDVTAFTTQREPKHYFYLKLVYNLSISLLRKVALLFRSLKNIVMATVLRIINFLKFLYHEIRHSVIKPREKHFCFPKGLFPLTRFWLRTLMHVNFNHVIKIEARYKVLRLNVKLSEVLLLRLRATFHKLPLFSRFANVNFTHVRTYLRKNYATVEVNPNKSNVSRELLSNVF